MPVVEEVTGFEVFMMGRIGFEEACVHQAIGGVEHPDGAGHRERGGEGKADVVGGGDEPRPERGDRWRVKGEEMPEGKRVRAAVYRFERGFGWSCCRHFFFQFIYFS
jgi:hypothetical protein